MDLESDNPQDAQGSVGEERPPQDDRRRGEQCPGGTRRMDGDPHEEEGDPCLDELEQEDQPAGYWTGGQEVLVSFGVSAVSTLSP